VYEKRTLKHCDSSIPPHKETDCHDDDRDQDCDLDHIRQCHVHTPQAWPDSDTEFPSWQRRFQRGIKKATAPAKQKRAADRNED
jgi:hypothetical protein